jgi:hypothetical protein
VSWAAAVTLPEPSNGCGHPETRAHRQYLAGYGLTSAVKVNLDEPSLYLQSCVFLAHMTRSHARVVIWAYRALGVLVVMQPRHLALTRKPDLHTASCRPKRVLQAPPVLSTHIARSLVCE